MNTNSISNSYDYSIGFEASFTGDDGDGGCTTGGDFPHPGSLSAFADGVDKDAKGEGGGTVTCREGTHPVTSIEGQTVTVVCKDGPPPAPPKDKPQAPIIP